MLFIKGTEIKKLECVGLLSKISGTRLRNLKKKQKCLSERGCLTDTTIDRLQIYIGVTSYLSKCWEPAKYEIKFFSSTVSCYFK